MIAGESGLRRFPPDWVPDAVTTMCQNPGCGKEFDTLNRRHHCRACGKIFCDTCSSRCALVPPFWEGANLDYKTRDPQRVCDACFANLERYQYAWAEENANANRDNAIALDDYSTRYMNSPLRFTLGGEVRKAAYALRNLSDGVNYWEGDAEYFDKQLAGADGLMFLTVGKIAFIGGVRVGTGLVIARLPDSSWSAPCAVGSFGITFGAVVGAEVTDFITPLDKNAIDEFCDQNTSKVAVGGEMGLALGPLGRTAGGDLVVASDSSSSTMTSYAQSRGFYGGVTLDAAYVKVRDDVNLKFYGRNVNAADLLRGIEKQPNAATPLYEQLNDFYALLDQRMSLTLQRGPFSSDPNQYQPPPQQQQQQQHMANFHQTPPPQQYYSPPPQQQPQQRTMSTSSYGPFSSSGGGPFSSAPPAPQQAYQVPPQQFTDVQQPFQETKSSGVGDSLFGTRQTKNPFAPQPPLGASPMATPAPVGGKADVVEV